MSTMVSYGDPGTLTVSVATDLSAKLYHFVNLSDGGQVPVAAIASGATAFPFVLLEAVNGSTTATKATVATSGIVTLKAGGTITAGAKLTATTGGAAIVTTTDTNHYGAIALQAAASGSEFKALVAFGLVAG